MVDVKYQFVLLFIFKSNSISPQHISYLRQLRAGGWEHHIEETKKRRKEEKKEEKKKEERRKGKVENIEFCGWNQDDINKLTSLS